MSAWSRCLQRGSLLFPRPQLPQIVYRRYNSTTQSILPDDIYDIVVVGGGIAGLALADSIASFDQGKELKIALLERNALKMSVLNGPPGNRCSSLTPGSVRFLQEIGAWKLLQQERIQPYYDMQEVWDGISSARIEFGSALARHPVTTTDESGQEFIDLDAQPTIATMVENSNLISALLERLNDFPHVKFLDNTTIEEITYGPDTEQYDLTGWPVLRTPSGPIAARLLVGADGPNSLVRKFAKIESRGWSYDRMGVVATLKSEPSWITPTAWQRFLPTGPIAHLPMPNDYVSLVWSTTPSIAKMFLSLPGDTFAALVNAAFRLSHVDLQYLFTVASPEEITNEIDWRESLLNENENMFPPRVVSVEDDSRAAFPLRLSHVDEYISSRIALVGDAAHTVHPLAGQGLNLGLADVKSLTNAIRESFYLGLDIGFPTSISRYPLERYGANHQMLGVCDKLHKLYSFNNPLAVTLRSWGLEAVNEIGPLKHDVNVMIGDVISPTLSPLDMNQFPILPTRQTDEGDTLQYAVYPIYPDVNLKNVMDYALDLMSTWTDNYIWNLDSFTLNLDPSVPRLYGSMDLGEDSTASPDEWIVVGVLWQVSKRFHDIVISVQDTDGEFLLIESAMHIPDWLKPETAENRVWIHNGELKIIPLEEFTAHDPPPLSLEDALAHLRRAIRSEGTTGSLFTDTHMNQAIQDKVKGFPMELMDQLHLARVILPRLLAQVIHHTPQLIAPGVQAFLTRTSQVKKLREMKYFPPEDWVTVNIQFSKPLYIMLKSQKFIPPPSFPPRDLSASEREAYHLGIKLTCAFEILCSASSAWGQKVLEVRNIEKQRKVCDSEIQSWDENQEEPGDEEWMTLSTADVRRIMGEDKSEEEQVKEMIANLEKFMEGESGFEGIDDEFMDIDRDDDEIS